MRDKLIYLIGLVAIALLFFFALTGCCSNDWKPLVGDTYMDVVHKLGPPTIIEDTDCYWRMPNGRNLYYVRFDRWPRFRGWKIAHDGVIDETHEMEPARVQEFTWNTHALGDVTR